MRLDDDDRYDNDFDYDYMPGKIKFTTIAMGISFFILIVLALVLLVNQQSRRNVSKPIQSEEVTEVEQEVDEYGYPLTSELLDGNKIKPEDLDFWDMYPADSSTEETEATGEGMNGTNRPDGQEALPDGTGTNPQGDSEKKPEDAADGEETDAKDKLDDGKHTLITYADGTTEWVVINPYLSKNSYDFTKLITKEEDKKSYEDGKNKSFLGVDLSRYDEYVDFSQLKDEGIDFVMLRVGQRGYSSGQITADEYFADNIKRATEAGLDVGLYFFSQAVTAEEAVEEANFVLQNIGEYKIQYPIAIDMEFIENDTSRVEAVSRADRTTIVKAFMDAIEAAGHKSMVYGNKEWFIKRLDLTKLTEEDFWLADYNDTPDYPYRFSMWQYSVTGELNGIKGDANMNICFIDYSAR